MTSQKSQCDNLVLSCIDYRFPHLLHDYLNKNGHIENYDIHTLPGASLGACCDEYPHWNKTFTDIITLAMGLHNIKKVIVIDHEDCGAFQKLRGVPETKTDELKMHVTQAQVTKKWLEENFPQLDHEFIYMRLDGTAKAIL